MKAYQPYVDSLEVLISEAASASFCRKKLSDHLGSDSSCTELRRLVTLNEMRESGIFFTHKSLSRFALAPILKTIGKDSVVLDPACGSGNLLAECTRRLPVESSLKDTLKLWGEHIVGRDLYKEFVSATKGRLILEAVHRGAKVDLRSPRIQTRLFPDVVAKSIFASESAFERATHIVMNPPYSVVEAPDNCCWASGSVNSAAVFVESCVTKAVRGAHVVAILPDVLRSGARYKKWRSVIQKQVDIRSIRTYGQFDKNTDVHVFVLEMKVRERIASGSGPAHQWISNSEKPNKVGTHFDVSVGAVVDYRDPHKGPWRPFVVAKKLPRWESIDSIQLNRRFKGKVLKPPFVVVRRTSRPEDKNRAVATIIRGKKPVAVENHLIVLSPKEKTLSSCKVLVENLQDPRTDVWLNRRIRCRHLTVSSLHDLPWWTDK